VVVTDESLSAGFDPNDRWSTGRTRIHLTGVQAIVRAIVDALRDDRESGVHTAAFVSGYQGSPLGGFDRVVESALATGLDVEIHARPAINEELAATAIMGTQVATNLETATHDGVLGIWYAKAPGLDRASDALRHANYVGSSKNGGVVAIVGDDPEGKSSTLPSASDATLVDLSMPYLYPGNIEEVRNLGRHAISLSRYCGSWVGLKIVTQIADAEGVIDLEPFPEPIWPGGSQNSGSNGALLIPESIQREYEVRDSRIRAAALYGDANALNRFVIAPQTTRVIVVASGPVFAELMKALEMLGLPQNRLQTVGIATVSVSMPFPLGEEFLASLDRGADAIVVVEERHSIIENQILSAFAQKPQSTCIFGRRGVNNTTLFPPAGALRAGLIAERLYPLLQSILGDENVCEPKKRSLLNVRSGPSRIPWFCSGCPHSVSTTVPDGSLVGEGIGCHSIVHYMPEDRVGRRVLLTQMGGEGAQWIGMSPFVRDEHLIQNMGDGTFFHSGELALRAAVAANVNITYKILWNGVTAMTGGQEVVGGVNTSAELAELLLKDGVKKVVITTDDLSRFRHVHLPKGVSAHTRKEIVTLQEELAKVPGVTALIHDQPCATELRRARKRGLARRPDFAISINERVCEGCGDCQKKSNCLSLQTIETPLGQKTRIDYDTCNIDRSCLQGDCPAFVLTRPKKRNSQKKQSKNTSQHTSQHIVLSDTPQLLADHPVRIRIAGIGGTGVVTAAHLLSWAALHDGLEVWGLDQTGLSQKAGPVISDIAIGPGAKEVSNVVDKETVEVLVAADLMAATSANVLSSLAPNAHAVASSATSMSGPMILGESDRRIPVKELLTLLAQRCEVVTADAVALAHGVGATASAANVSLLGMAAQLGLLPVSVAGIEASIRHAGVDVDHNLAAFSAGRGFIAESGVEPQTVIATAEIASLAEELSLSYESATHIKWLANDLVEYQNDQLAERFLTLVRDASAALKRIDGDARFIEGIAFSFHKLLAVKDEYEVARLHLDGLHRDAKTTWFFHPPLLRTLGLKRKIAIGPWGKPLLHLLKLMRHLRGTPLDIFAYSSIRRREFALAQEFETSIREICANLSATRIEDVISYAYLPDMVRGYEEVRAKAIDAYQEKRKELLKDLLA
jgi:indolepyruvate ferredoxin oxidoreductase